MQYTNFLKKFYLQPLKHTGKEANKLEMKQ